MLAISVFSDESNGGKWAQLQWERIILVAVVIKIRNQLLRDIAEFLS